MPLTNHTQKGSVRRLLALTSTLLLGMLPALGCSSTLDEFRCSSDRECIDDQGDGLCHSSGYCAFLDEAGCDGFRFGKLSGERSGLCVDAVADLDAGVATPPDAADEDFVDASLADAATSVEVDADLTNADPVANIEVASLGCDLTALNVDGTGSQAFGGRTLTSFAWKLSAPGGAIISELSGNPSSGFIPKRGFVSGNIEQPRINLTPYMDKNALAIDTGNAHSLVRQNNISLESGSHTLSFSIASALPEDVGVDVDVSVGSLSTGTAVSTDLVLSNTMTRHAVNFTVLMPLNDVRISIHADDGRFQVDNFLIHKDSTAGSNQAAVVVNPSLEMGLSPWVVASQNSPNAGLEAAAIATSLKQYGVYQLELIVIDSDDNQSEAATVQINHAACSGGNNGG